MEINPCAICGKEIKKGQEKLVSCQDLDVGHVNCNCGISVGGGCFKKLKLKDIRDVENKLKKMAGL